MLGLLLRPLFFAATTLPDARPAGACAPGGAWTWRKVLFGGCLDKIFSGHAYVFLLVVAALTLAGRLPQAWALGLAVAYSALVVAGRGHYTVDVLVAWLVAALLLSNRRRLAGWLV